MNFYRQLQLNQAGSKKLIRETTDINKKIQRIITYIFKVLLTVGFCFIFVTAFSIVLGSENSIVGVVTLLCVLVMRQSHLGIDAKHGTCMLTLIFLIFALGPHLANLLPAYGALAVNLICIFAIVLLGCHDIYMYNHATFVLSYLLLLGYDVTGHDFTMRLWGLLAGALIVCAVFYRNNKKREFQCTAKHIFTEFDLSTPRSRWQVKFTVILCFIMFIMQSLGFERFMWAGIASMSVLTPISEHMMDRVKWRAPGNFLGAALFITLSIILPHEIFLYVGVIGGICIGFSATYGWQTIFNSLGALSIASGIYGVPTAIFLRIFHNTAGPVLSLVFDRTLSFFYSMRTSPK